MNGTCTNRVCGADKYVCLAVFAMDGMAKRAMEQEVGIKVILLVISV